jgi:hypothetical protein
MEMLVGEQKQDGVALLLDPAGRRSLISPFRSSRKCRMFVNAVVTTDVALRGCRVRLSGGPVVPRQRV